ncbi:DMT family transporter [Dokdonia pacifica]|uniref:EamA-like transporter family protein n=1 Tax=Dokdonia pacifica TaxID=1627892 RepID=A0A239BCW1_9FLAO|nr:DMT family transporter [Dokdonia pacifica]SNS04843.1 EamA-like transporter family protein [Dokdonia pacifica]
MQNAKLRSYLHFHLIVFIWGFTAVLGSLISIDSVPLVWFRMGIASIFIFIYIKWKKIDISLSRKAFLSFSIAGIIIAVHWLTFFGAIKVSNVSITLAMMSTGAFFTALLEPIFYKRKLIWYEVLFGVIVIGALYLIFEVQPEYRLGIGLALLSALLSAIFTLVNGKFVHDHNPTKISFYELVVGTLFITAYLAFAKADTFFSTSFFDLPYTDWIYLFILASVCTAYAFIASVKVMRHLSPYTIMLTINLEPVYGILLAFMVLGDKEQMSPEFYYGAIVILLVVIANGILKNRNLLRSKKETAVK